MPSRPVLRSWRAGQAASRQAGLLLSLCSVANRQAASVRRLAPSADRQRVSVQSSGWPQALRCLITSGAQPGLLQRSASRHQPSPARTALAMLVPSWGMLHSRAGALCSIPACGAAREHAQPLPSCSLRHQSSPSISRAACSLHRPSRQRRQFSLARTGALASPPGRTAAHAMLQASSQAHVQQLPRTSQLRTACSLQLLSSAPQCHAMQRSEPQLAAQLC